MSKPITPEEAEATQKINLPDQVIDVINELIVENLRSGTAIIPQNNIINRISVSLNISSQEVLNKGYLEIENYYRDAGWSVKHDRPGYNESYTATFVFTKKR